MKATSCTSSQRLCWIRNKLERCSIIHFLNEVTRPFCGRVSTKMFWTANNERVLEIPYVQFCVTTGNNTIFGQHLNLIGFYRIWKTLHCTTKSASETTSTACSQPILPRFIMRDAMLYQNSCPLTKKKVVLSWNKTTSCMMGQMWTKVIFSNDIFRGQFTYTVALIAA